MSLRKAPVAASSTDRAAVQSESRSARILGIFVWCTVVAGLVALTLPTTRIFERAMVPELTRHAEALGDVIVAEVARAVAAGVPIDALVDMDGLVASTVDDYDQVRQVTLTDRTGKVIYSSAFHSRVGITTSEDAFETVRVPVTIKAATVATLSIQISADYLSGAVTDIGIDILTVLLAAALITFEMLAYLVATQVERPISHVAAMLQDQANGKFDVLADIRGFPDVARCLKALNRIVESLNSRYADICAATTATVSGASGATLLQMRRLQVALANGGKPGNLRSPSAADLRLPLFLFFLSTELSRSFLPIFSDSLYQPLLGWQHSIIVALPMTSYVFASLVTTPIAGSIVDRFGTRTAFLVGMLPTIASLIGQGFAPTIPVLAGWRVVEGFGFAVVSIASLDHIRQTSTTDTRAAGAVIYGAAYITASICGTSIGGILADRAGFAGAFFIAAFLAVMATQLSLGAIGKVTMEALPSFRFGSLRDLRPLRSRRFMAAALLLAWPAQMAITGFVYYATPLMLHEEGFSTSMIGRIVMAYFLSSLIASRLAARWADRDGGHRKFAIIGLGLSAIGTALPVFGTGPVLLILSVAIVGLAQAIGGPSRGAIMLEECADLGDVSNSSAIGLYRVLERCGALAGPLLVAAMVPSWGYKQAIFILGVSVLVAAAAYAISVRIDQTPAAPTPSGELA